MSTSLGLFVERRHLVMNEQLILVPATIGIACVIAARATCAAVITVSA